MKNIFYWIWVDTIVNIKKQPINKYDWKRKSLYLMTILISLNIMTIAIWVGRLGYKLDVKTIDIFPGTMLDSFVMYLMLYGIPAFLLNYGLIFYNDRYIKLIPKYKDMKGKLFIIYMFTTVAIFFIPISVIFFNQ